MTAEEFVRVSKKDEPPCELVRGRVVREKRYPKPIHGRLESRMAHLLESWMEQRLDTSAELEGDDVLPGFRTRLDAYFNL